MLASVLSALLLEFGHRRQSLVMSENRVQSCPRVPSSLPIQPNDPSIGRMFDRELVGNLLGLFGGQ